MPYKKGQPPDRIKMLPKHAQDIWIAAFNSADSSGKSEESCNKIAWAAVKQTYEQDEDGKWVEKEKMSARDMFTNFLSKVATLAGEFMGQEKQVENVNPGLIISRQADGKLRWLCVACTSVLNRVNQIDSTRLFDSFIQRIAEGAQYPELDFLHTKGTEMGTCDYLARDGNVLIASGTFHNERVGSAVAQSINARPGYWGTSIQYAIRQIVLDSLSELPNGLTAIYTNGILRRISILPESEAASLFTEIKAGKKEEDDMNESVLSKLRELIGDELAEEYSKKVDAVQSRIAEEGLITRQVEQVAEATNQQKAVVEQITPIVDEGDKGTEANAMAMVLDGLKLQIEQLNQALSAMANSFIPRLEALEVSERERKRTWLAGIPAKRQEVLFRPSEQAETKAATNEPYSAIAKQTLGLK